MAMNVSWNEIGNHDEVTLKSALVAADKGKVCKLSANDTGALGSAEDLIFGLIKQVDDDGGLTVQHEGFITVTYTGSAPSVGQAELACNGSGGVKLVATPGTPGKKYLVVNVDTSGTKVTFKLF